MRLVEDAKTCWRWLSVQIAALGIVALEAYQQVSTLMPDIVKSFPDSVVHRVMQVLLSLIIIGRLIKQGGNDVKPPIQ